MALLGTLQVRLGLDAGTFSSGMSRFTKDEKKQTDGLANSLANLEIAGVQGELERMKRCHRKDCPMRLPG